MTFLQRWFAWYLEVEISTEPGTVLTWQWLLRSPIAGIPFWVVACVVLTLFALVLMARRLPREETRREQRWTWALQLCAVLLFLLMLGRFAIQVRLTGLPALLVMVDTSASMQLEDGYSDRDASTLDRQLQSASLASLAMDRQRLRIAQGVLLQRHGAWLQSLQERYRVVLLPVADGIIPLDADQAHRGAARPLEEEIRQLSARGVRTNLRAALRDAMQLQRGQVPAALLILTDGNSTADPQDRLSVGLRDLGRRAPPVFVVGTGANAAGRNVEVVEVVPPGLAFVGEPFVVRARLEGTGVAGESVAVQLVDQRTGQLLDSDEVNLVSLDSDAERAGADVTFRHTSENAGPLTLEVRCLPVPGEEQALDNVIQTRLWIRSTQLRVLLVDAVPRWEFRHLKSALERDPSAQLHTFLLESDPEIVREDRTALPRLPETLEEWLEYDVILWGGIPLDRVHVSRDDLIDFVADHGGGLLLLPDRHSSTVADFAELSPIQLETAVHAETETEPVPVPVQIHPTLDGRAAACLQFTIEGMSSPLAQLPRLYGAPGDALLRAGAVALLEAERANGDAVPLLIEQRFGAGLVMLQRFDSTWSWRPLAQGQVYRQYWLQLVRYLGQRKLDTLRSAFELQVNRAQFGPGMPVHLTLRTNEPATHGQLVVRGPGLSERLVDMKPQGGPNEWEVSLEGLDPGSYTAQLPRDLSTDSPTVAWSVLEGDPERTYRPMHLTDLKQAAKLSGGRFYRPWETASLPDDLPAGTSLQLQRQVVVPLWNRWELLVLLTILLSVDWYSRR